MGDQFEAALAAGERLFHTVEHGDLQDLREIFSPGAMVWHNTDEKLTDVETTIRNLENIRSGASVFRYTEIKREPTPSGFVQQHLLTVEMPDGRSMRDLACCICRVEDGRIAHMDAYHDSAVVNGMAHRKAEG
ncbi:MAG: nuclear transport factor 2 family protein [Sphingomonadales bacterium]|nr:MAG: nuclear transport factor 2 family protein [Sphingomonadales bacterium]